MGVHPVLFVPNLTLLLIFKPKFYFMQKTFYLMLIFISAGLVSNAQITKGSLLLGGDIGFIYQSSNNPLNNPAKFDQTIFFFSPSFGKAVNIRVRGGCEFLAYQQFDDARTQLGLLLWILSLVFDNGAHAHLIYRWLGKEIIQLPRNLRRKLIDRG